MIQKHASEETKSITSNMQLVSIRRENSI